MKDYKKILEGVVNIVSTTENSDVVANICVYIDENCPELKESEDEKIRKVLVDFFKSYKEQGTCGAETFNGISTSNILAWLEKQGEKPQGKSALEAAKEEKVDNQNCAKPADNIEPKFKVGDWITNGEYTWKVTDIKSLDYILQSQDGNIVDDTISYVDEHFRLWTINDARKGDVLYSLDSNQLFIYKERKQNEQATAYCGLNIYGKFFVWGTKDCVITLSKYVPATKEQRDALKKAMTDAGWEFDFDKKELKKIEQKFNIGDEIKTANEEPLTITKIDEKGYWSEDLFICGFDDTAKWEVVGQKTAWSEEDDDAIGQAIVALEDMFDMDIFRISSRHPIIKRYWTFCGDDYGYNLFKDKKPKEVAINIIRQVFNGQDIDNMQFAYKPFCYKGKNNLQDRIEVYYRIK